MKIKYVSPELEIVKFSLKTSILTASGTDDAENLGTTNYIPGEEEPNPFG